jgi:rSAM/selenodomain-associated transferase 2
MSTAGVIEGTRPRISVVVPALDEAAGIAATLRSVLTARDVEVIVADGGSQDATRNIARSMDVRIVEAERGRATQMNAGAVYARAPVFLFLHADTRLPALWDEHVLMMLAQPDVIGGAFRLAFDRKDLRLDWIAHAANARSRWFGLPYGDQAIFVRTDAFWSIGGFEEVPIMEDVRFMRRVLERGRVGLCAASVETSARRWTDHGIVRTTLVNGACLIAHCAGVEPQRIAHFRATRARTARTQPSKVFVSPRRGADLG